MAQSMTAFEVVHDTLDDEFTPCGLQVGTMVEARKELRRVKARYPKAFIVKVTYSRLMENTIRKGR